MTKVEKRWRWIANRIWGDSMTGWSTAARSLTKGDRAIFERRLKAGQIETSEFGDHRLTEAGRAALAPVEGENP